MTRSFRLMLCMAFVLGLTAAVSAQSLGDVARKERVKEKPQSARTYTNEDIPSADIPKEQPKAADGAAPAAAAEGRDNKDALKDDGMPAVANDVAKEPAAKDAAAKDAPKDAKDAGKDSKEPAKPEKTDAEKQAALNAEWKAKVAEAKKNVTSLEREIDLMQREDRLRVAVYYSDAGNRLRDDKAWGEQEKKYQDDLAARQKDLSGAKEKLSGVLDNARKAGATAVE